jgi:hypothetical protein
MRYLPNGGLLQPIGGAPVGWIPAGLGVVFGGAW